jgi:hypothetical protein
MLLTAVLMPASESSLTALNPETGTSETIEEALANLCDATEFYLEEFTLAVSGVSRLLTTWTNLHRESGRCPMKSVDRFCARTRHLRSYGVVDLVSTRHGKDDSHSPLFDIQLRSRDRMHACCTCSKKRHQNFNIWAYGEIARLRTHNE